jgi:hypothetical protein
VGMKVLDHLRVCVKVAYCCDPSSTGTLTYDKTLETCVESDFATYNVRFAIAGHFFVLVRMVRSYVHIIKLPN